MNTNKDYRYIYSPMVEDKPKRDLDGIVIVVVCLAVLIFFGVEL